MEEYYGLVVEKEAPLWIIRINRPEINCKINMETGNAITRAIEDANKDRDVKVIILTGTGEYFCGNGQVTGIRYAEAAGDSVSVYGPDDRLFRTEHGFMQAAEAV